MTTETTTKKRTTRKKKAETTATVAETSTTCNCGNCDEQIELLTASCKNLDEKMTTLIQYIKTFNQFLNQSMISNVVDGAAEEGLTEVLDTLTDVPNPISI